MSEPAILAVDNLTVRYGTRTVVEGLSLEVGRGRCLGIIGESGAGKSQAFLALLGLLPPQAAIQGQARLRGEDLLAPGGQALRGRRVAMIFQDPLTSLTPHLRIGEQIAEPLIVHRGWSRREAWSRAAELLQQVRVNDVPRRLRQYPHELSGGMRQRVMIAIALAGEPELLIADEPTTALDVSVQAQLLALLRQLVTQQGMSLVVITHDMGVVAALADEVMVLRQGRLVERGEVTDILSSPRQAYTRELLAATPRIDEVVTDAGESPGASVAPPLQLRDLVVRHTLHRGGWLARQQLTAVEGAAFTVQAGEALGIVGESGCGKSSLVRALLRLHPVARGEIVWLGHPIQDLEGEELRRLRAGLQMVFQDPVASLDPLQPVSEIVAEPLRALRPELGAAERDARVRAMLAAVGLGDEHLSRRGRELSGGQCQRVAIARAMVLEPKLLVCDEAVSSLDVSIQAQVLELLARFKRERGVAIVFVSHNLAVVRRLCEHVAVMYLGRIVEQGPTVQVFRSPLHPYTRLLLDSVPRLDPASERARLQQLPAEAETPSAVERPPGCAFHARCPAAQDRCATSRPETESAGDTRDVACWRWRELADFHISEKQR